MITIAELARALGAEAVGDLGLAVAGAAEPAAAGPDQIALAMQPASPTTCAKGGRGRRSSGRAPTGRRSGSRRRSSRRGRATCWPG